MTIQNLSKFIPSLAMLASLGALALHRYTLTAHEIHGPAHILAMTSTELRVKPISPLPSTLPVMNSGDTSSWLHHHKQTCNVLLLLLPHCSFSIPLQCPVTWSYFSCMISGIYQTLLGANSNCYLTRKLFIFWQTSFLSGWWIKLSLRRISEYQRWHNVVV